MDYNKSHWISLSPLYFYLPKNDQSASVKTELAFVNQNNVWIIHDVRNTGGTHQVYYPCSIAFSLRECLNPMG